MGASLANNFSFFFDFNNDENDREIIEKETKLLKNGLIFGVVTAVSFLSNSNIDYLTNMKHQLSKNIVELDSNTINSKNFTNESEEKISESIRLTSVSSKSDSSMVIDLSETDKEDTEKYEVLNMADIKRLEDKLDKYLENNHEKQLEFTKVLTKVEATVDNTDKKINTLTEDLSETIQTEIGKMKLTGYEKFQDNYLGPIIVAVIVGLAARFL